VAVAVGGIIAANSSLWKDLQESYATPPLALTPPLRPDKEYSKEKAFRLRALWVVLLRAQVVGDLRRGLSTSLLDRLFSDVCRCVFVLAGWKCQCK